MSLSKPQRGVALGAGSALAVTAVTLLVAAMRHTEALGLDARLHLLALSVLAPALTLLVCIGRLANHRFDSPEDLDGSGLTIGSARAKLLQALLQNTLEQLALVLPVYAACTLLGSPWLVALVPVASVLFLLGRGLFFWGYGRGAPGRAMGFGLTFYPTAILLVCALVASARHAVS
ncbi:MAPEG family protein [Lysobacter sp. HA18]